MTHSTALNDPGRPWYRQFWPWLLIGLPASAVLGGIATLVIAVNNPDALVVDDYYKAGLAINRVKHRQAMARDLGVTGLLRSDGRHLVLNLGGEIGPEDQRLTLHMIHATRAELDREVVLQRSAAGTWEADLPDLPPGPRYLRLQPANGSWEIRARFVIDGPFQTRLTFED